MLTARSSVFEMRANVDAGVNRNNPYVMRHYKYLIDKQVEAKLPGTGQP
jgi:hypothetical protein